MESHMSSYNPNSGVDLPWFQTSEASKLVERRRDAEYSLDKMNKYIDSLKTKFRFENTLKKIKVASPKVYKYRGSRKKDVV